MFTWHPFVAPGVTDLVSVDCPVFLGLPQILRDSACSLTWPVVCLALVNNVANLTSQRGRCVAVTACIVGLIMACTISGRC